MRPLVKLGMCAAAVLVACSTQSSGLDGGVGGTGGGTTAQTGDGSTSTPSSDSGSCDLCTNALTPARSLDCYCQKSSCDQTFADALGNPIWSLVDEGCGRLVIWEHSGAGDGQMESFDAVTGRLVGAATWSDVAGSACVSPRGVPGINAYAAGGRDFYRATYETPCQTTRCALDQHGYPLCDIDALRQRFGEDAGSSCADGEVRALVLVSCSPTYARGLTCVTPCKTQNDCPASNPQVICEDGLCKPHCPF